MHKRTAVISILLAFILPCPTATWAQQPVALTEWSVVQNVATGEDLIIKLKNGKSAHGKLSNVTDAEVRISRNNKEQAFNKDEIQEIHHSRGKAAKAKYALIGAGVGAGVGAIAGKAKNSPAIDDGEIYIIALTPIVAGAGAAVGWLIGQGRRKRVLIYQAK